MKLQSFAYLACVLCTPPCCQQWQPRAARVASAVHAAAASLPTGHMPQHARQAALVTPSTLMVCRPHGAGSGGLLSLPHCMSTPASGPARAPQAAP